MRSVGKYSNDVCPITLDKMNIPAEISTRHVFEESAILRHIEFQLDRGLQPNCPLTRIPLKPFVQAPQNQLAINARAYIKPQTQWWQRIRPSLATLQQCTTVLGQFTGAMIGARLGYHITSMHSGKEVLRLSLSLGSFLLDLHKLRTGQSINQFLASFYALGTGEQNLLIQLAGLGGGAAIGLIIGCGIERKLNARLAQAYGIPLQMQQVRRDRLPAAFAHYPINFIINDQQNS